LGGGKYHSFSRFKESKTHPIMEKQAISTNWGINLKIFKLFIENLLEYRNPIAKECKSLYHYLYFCKKHM
jgi:hypothetical protein